MNLREAKALQLIPQIRPTGDGRKWLVPSQSGNGSYHVNPYPPSPSCTCPDHEITKSLCKHIIAVRMILNGQPHDNEPKDKKPTYRQVWPAYNAAQTHEKAVFQSLLFELVQAVDEPNQERGRPRLLLSEMVFAAAFKVYSTVSGRRFISDLRDAHEKGYLSKVPHYNSIFNYLEMQSLTPYLKMMISYSAAPLKAIETDFAVDGSGFATLGQNAWFIERYGRNYHRRGWLKMHLMCGVKTNIVTSVEISGGDSNDSPYFPALVTRTAQQGFRLHEVSADKAYSSRANLRLVTEQGGTPYIAFKENATEGREKGDTTWKRMFHAYSLHREEFLQHYHKRSNVESTFSMIKAKFGERIRSKTQAAQINEALLKVLCHNICVVIQSVYELGIEPTFWAKSDSAQKST